MWGGSEGGDWERRENYLTAQREWTKLDRNVPYLVSFCTEEENTNFFAQPRLVINIAAKPCKVRTTSFGLISRIRLRMAWGTQILLRLRHSYQGNLKFQSYSGRGIHSMNFNISETR